MPRPMQDQCHSLTLSFCRPGALRTECEDFVAGAPAHALSLFSHQCGRLSSILLCEIAVERKHAQFNRELETSPHSGAAKLSLVDRYPEIREHLRAQPAEIQRLGRVMSKVAHPVNAAIHMGYAGHPDWQPIAAQHHVVDETGVVHDWLGTSHAHSKIAKQIVYHIDTTSQFLDLSKLEKEWGGEV